ncbi:circadian-associated transcriptional repressor-like [Betta splendens]|uniref:Circadian-associated transcriptional repressor-like n=1 Tax=Betta splendens TaxID=158456 RepID=A0A6P7KVF4_BETSP|nr:circadian-associated transcriptional repressor-like [Betta splendens]
MSRITPAMQSQGSTSSQPSFDSLSPSGSPFFSDSEPADDDTDVFLTDSSSSLTIGGTGGEKATEERGSKSPRSQWTCNGSKDKETEEEPPGSRSGSKAAQIRLDEADPLGQSQKSQGDLLFAQKCAELQGFVRPLLELLNGLKTGRFDRGLSSFQQSVAMDRIQRIVGVLQRPNSGEKYLNTLLQVEMMLKLWFPHITTQPAPAASSVATSTACSLQETSSSTPPHKHRDQLHIPVKKRRLSWTGTDSPTPSPVLLKCPRTTSEEKKVKQDQDQRDSPPPRPQVSDADQNSPDVACSSQLGGCTKGQDSGSEEPGKLSQYKAGQSSEPSLTWVHIAPILSPRKACASHESASAAGGESQPVAAVLSPGRRGSPATQDSAVSSTTPYKHTKNLKKPIRCQSQHAAGQESDGETSDACQGQSQSPHVTLKPSPKVCPTP